jgi:hypothetical protein
MRLVVYIRAAGFDPTPFDHPTFQSYRACLQQQYVTLRAGMDKESGRQARLAGRKLVRLHTLKRAAGDALPDQIPSAVRSNRRDAGCHSGRPSVHLSVPSPVLSSATSSPSRPTDRETVNCRRKLRHVNYLSALFHLARLGDVGLHAYPCELCDGIHVGHHPDRVRLRDLEQEVASITARLEVLATERDQLETRRALLSARREQLLNAIYGQIGLLPATDRDEQSGPRHED